MYRIFGYADLRPGRAAESVLRAHMEASAYFRGVRSAFPSQPDDAFLAGFALLGKLNLSFDNYSPNADRLPALARLAATQPDVPVIVNHLGGRIDPEAGQESFDAWRKQIDAIASAPNAVMKLGGAQQRVGPWEPPFHLNRTDSPAASEWLCDRLYPWYAPRPAGLRATALPVRKQFSPLTASACRIVRCGTCSNALPRARA